MTFVILVVSKDVPTNALIVFKTLFNPLGSLWQKGHKVALLPK